MQIVLSGLATGAIYGLVAASTSMISTPVPYRAMTWQRVKAPIAFEPSVAYWAMTA